MDLHDSVTIAASPATVWGLVGDLTRMAEWSPQVDSTRMSGTTSEGTRFTNRNVHGELAWITHGEVVRHEPERHLAFRIEENWAVWSFDLEATADGGTVLHQHRTTPEGISPLSLELTEGYLGGLEEFTRTLRAGMRSTLAGIRASAEGAPG